MASARPFRFGAAGLMATSLGEWAACARRVEALGYATLVVGQHPAVNTTGPIAALAATAAATTSLRLASQVVANDFYHPAVLAAEAATIDVLSGGRLEFGLGAGWLRLDYEATGVPFEPPGVRVGRLEEAVGLIKRLFRGETVTFSGAHYRAAGLTLRPPPVQRPHPPIFLGGGS